MKSPDNKNSNKTLKTKVENKISNAIKSELPKLHLKMLPTTLSTKARTASPAKKMRISASKLKNRKTAFI